MENPKSEILTTGLVQAEPAVQVVVLNDGAVHNWCLVLPTKL